MNFTAEGRPFAMGQRFANAMYAPTANRFRTYSVSVAKDTQVYVDAVLAHPFVAEWIAGASEQARQIG